MASNTHTSAELAVWLADPGAFVFSKPVEPKSLVDGLWWAWDEAQYAAELAYLEWARAGGHEAYFSYRAAQDRADAAQDALAGGSRASRRRGPSG
jgi:hypothetical protein